MTRTESRVAVAGMTSHDLEYMRRALNNAQAAAERGEAPIGAVVIDPSSGKVVSEAGNAPIGLHDPSAHAEILALRAAGAEMANYRLTDLWLYVTLEPCAMCAGAISHARIGRLIFGASDPKGGAILHGPRYFDQPTCHWRPEVSHGVLADDCATLLRDFFRARRRKGG